MNKICSSIVLLNCIGAIVLVHNTIRNCIGALEDRKQNKDLIAHATGEGNGTPLQYSCLENPMDGGAWKAAVHGVAEGRTRLTNFTFTFHFHALEKEMATHSSVLAWRIPGTGEPGGLPSMGSHKVGHNLSDLVAAAAAHAKKIIFFFSNILFLFKKFIKKSQPFLKKFKYFAKYCVLILQLNLIN